MSMVNTRNWSILRRARRCAAAAALLCSLPLAAHDFWIEPTAFSAVPGQTVGLKFRVGEQLAGDALPLIPSRVIRFIVHDGDAHQPVTGRPGADPAGFVKTSRPGLLVVGYHGRPSYSELEADKFGTYLAEEGLDAILALRARRGQSTSKAREIYSRCAKSLVVVGAPASSMSDRYLGFPLELVAERVPHLLRAGEPLPVRLTYEGKPLAGALVVAVNTANPAMKQSMRTDPQGRAVLKIKPGGMWLVKAVHMVEAPAGSDADWSSFWASLTFAVPLGDSPGNIPAGALKKSMAALSISTSQE
jgi:uncharacterized GH25 family protein